MEDPEFELADHLRHVRRLRRIEGQVRGLAQMIVDGRPHPDVLLQFDASMAALRKIRSDIVLEQIQAQVRATLPESLGEQERERITADLVRAATKLV